MNAVSDAIKHHPSWCLTKCCEHVESTLNFNCIKCYSRPTLMFHWKRLHSFPERYDGKARVFPVSLGRTLRLSSEMESALFTRINLRISRKDLKYPSIVTFIKIGYNLLGYRFSYSWMSSFLKRHNCKYGPPIQAKSGTRYRLKDSERVLKERIDYILKRIWYMAWEKGRKMFHLCS